MDLTEPLFDEIYPLFWIAHIVGRVFGSLLDSFDGRIESYILISVDILLCDDINDFFSGKFFVLSCFCYECLIGFCVDIFFNEILSFVFLLDLSIFIFNSRNKIVRFELVKLVVAYQIQEVDDKNNQADEDITKTRVHNFLFSYFSI